MYHLPWFLAHGSEGERAMGVSFVLIFGFLLCSNILAPVPEMASEPQGWNGCLITHNKPRLLHELMNKSTEIFTFIPLNSLSYQISSSNQIPKQNFYGCSGTIRNTGMASGEPFWVHGLSHHFWGLLVCVESVPEFALRVLAWNVINVVCHRNWGSDWEDWARLRGVPRLTFTWRQQHLYTVVCGQSPLCFCRVTPQRQMSLSPGNSQLLSQTEMRKQFKG